MSGSHARGRARCRVRRPWRSAPSPELSYPCPTVTGMAQTQCTAGPEGLASPGEPGDVPRRPALSPSRANDFKQCPLLYRFRAIDRLPEVPTAAQVRGTLVHAVLEQLFLLPAEERTPEAARALLGPTWAQLCADDPGLPAALFGDGSSGPDRSGPDGDRRRGRRPDDLGAGCAGPVPTDRVRGLAGERRAAARRLLRPRGPAPARTGGPGAARRGRAGVGAAAARVRRSGRPHRDGRRHDPGGRLQDRQRAPADRRGAGAVPDEVLRAGAADACAA